MHARHIHACSMCNMHATQMQHAGCSVCGAYIQCSATNLQHTCNTHATHMQHTSASLISNSRTRHSSSFARAPTGIPYPASFSFASVSLSLLSSLAMSVSRTCQSSSGSGFGPHRYQSRFGHPGSQTTWEHRTDAAHPQSSASGLGPHRAVHISITAEEPQPGTGKRACAVHTLAVSLAGGGS